MLLLFKSIVCVLIFYALQFFHKYTLFSGDTYDYKKVKNKYLYAVNYFLFMPFYAPRLALCSFIFWPSLIFILYKYI